MVRNFRNKDFQVKLCLSLTVISRCYKQTRLFIVTKPKDDSMKLNVLLVLVLSCANQAFSAGMQTVVSCADEAGTVSVDLSFSEDNAVSMWDLRLEINQAEAKNVQYESLMAGDKIVGRYVTFAEGTLTILDNGDSSYANAMGRVNGLLVWKTEGERAHTPMICAASISEL